jgi:hypothetical protein
MGGYALAVPVGNKMGQRPKGSGEHSIAGKGGQKRNYLAYDRQGKMHMVKVILLKLQPKAELEGHAHLMIVHVSRRELGGEVLYPHIPHCPVNPNQHSRATVDTRRKRAKRAPKCIASPPQWKHGIHLSRRCETGHIGG